MQASIARFVAGFQSLIALVVTTVQRTIDAITSDRHIVEHLVYFPQ